jgi:pimeloyl-ACP methyl ester carboxylesterase
MTGHRKDGVHFLGQAGRIVGDRWSPGDDGKGTVLLLHGGGQTRHSWQKAGPALADDGWTTVAVDFRGHGDSDWAPDGHYSIDGLVDDIAAVMAGLDRPPVIIGASMGGLTGLVTAGERPEAVRGLVLVDATPRIEPTGARRITTFMRNAPQGFGSLEEVAEAIREYQPHRTRPVNVDGLRKNVRRGDDGRWYWHWDPRFVRTRPRAETGRAEARVAAAATGITVPTLLVRGALSDVVTEDGVAELLAAIPHARHVDVAGTGHMVAGDDNSVFLAEVTGFLDSVAGASRPNEDYSDR